MGLSGSRAGAQRPSRSQAAARWSARSECGELGSWEQLFDRDGIADSCLPQLERLNDPERTEPNDLDGLEEEVSRLPARPHEMSGNHQLARRHDTTGEGVVQLAARLVLDACPLAVQDNDDAHDDEHGDRRRRVRVSDEEASGLPVDPATNRDEAGRYGKARCVDHADVGNGVATLGSLDEPGHPECDRPGDEERDQEPLTFPQGVPTLRLRETQYPCHIACTCRLAGATMLGFFEEAQMSSVYNVVELIGTSSESWEDAARAAITEAAKTLRDLRVAEVVEQDVVIEGGAITQFRTKVRLSFKHESSV